MLSLPEVTGARGTLRMEGAAKSDRVCDGGCSEHLTRGRAAQILRDKTGKVQPGVASALSDSLVENSLCCPLASEGRSLVVEGCVAAAGISPGSKAPPCLLVAVSHWEVSSPPPVPPFSH